MMWPPGECLFFFEPEPEGQRWTTINLRTGKRNPLYRWHSIIVHFPERAGLRFYL
jgi:hypothetical protein